MAYKCNNILSVFLTEDLCTRGHCAGDTAASQLMSGNLSFLSSAVWEQSSSCCRCPSAPQLSLGLWCVQEDGAEGGEDLPGLGGGQLTLGPHQAHAVSFLQGQDQAEGHRASAATPLSGLASVLATGALQPLNTAVRH